MTMMMYMLRHAMSLHLQQDRHAQPAPFIGVNCVRYSYTSFKLVVSACVGRHGPAGRCEHVAEPLCSLHRDCKVSAIRGLWGGSRMEFCKFAGNYWLGLQSSHRKTQDLDLNDEP